MLNNFYKDLEDAKAAELFIRDELARRTNDYDFFAIGDIKEYRYKGDIKAVDKNGNEIFIEVKNDSRFADTWSILCEEECYLKEDDRFIKGNMYCDSDIYCVLSERERIIYVFDFKILKNIYKMGEYKIIQHSQQNTHCYLLELCRAKQFGALITKIKY